MNNTSQSFKIIFATIFALIITSNALAVPNQDNVSSDKAPTETSKSPCDNIFQKIDTHAYLPDQFTVLSKTPMDNLCEVILESNKKYLTLYVSDNYVMVGDIFKDHKALTKRTIDQIEGRVIQENRAQLEECVVVSYKPVNHNLNRSIYMISDPECYFCKMATGEITRLADRYGFNVKIILYPLGDESKSIEVACRQMTFEEYASDEFASVTSETIQGDSFCERGIEVIDKSKQIAQKIGINAVPTFVFAETGQKVAGADMKKLEKEIIVNLAEFENQLVRHAAN